MSSDWYWVQDENFRFVALAGLEKRGLGPEVFMGKARWELPNVAPVPEKVWQRHRDLLERHEPFSDFVYAATDSAGELRYLSVTGEPIFDAEGRFRGYHGIGKDISATARAQKALEDSELRYRMLFDIHPHPMWVVENKTLRFLAVNQAALDQYGYTREEFLKMTAEQLRYPRTSPSCSGISRTRAARTCNASRGTARRTARRSTSKSCPSTSSSTASPRAWA